MKTYLLSFFLVLIIFSCNSKNRKDHSEQNIDLNGEWLLERLDGVAITEQVSPVLIINLEEMKINGTDGCNSYFGQIKELSEEYISFSELGSTRKMCIDMDIPDRYNMGLAKIRSYSLNDEILVFMNDKGTKIFNFKRAN